MFDSDGQDLITEFRSERMSPPPGAHGELQNAELNLYKMALYVHKFDANSVPILLTLKGAFTITHIALHHSKRILFRDDKKMTIVQSNAIVFNNKIHFI